MKVKELYRKYKNYDIILYGVNKHFSFEECIKKVTPFSYLKTINNIIYDKTIFLPKMCKSLLLP